MFSIFIYAILLNYTNTGSMLFYVNALKKNFLAATSDAVSLVHPF